MGYIGSKPANTVLTSQQIEDGAVGTNDLASGAVTTVKMADASVTQAKLASGVAGTGPAFSAYQSSAQTINSGVWTKCAFQTKTFDTANCFDNTTNYRFTPNVAGYYWVTGQFGANVGGDPYINGAIYKNGSQISWSLVSSGTGIYIGIKDSTLVYLNGSTDYVEFYVNPNGSGSRTIFNGSAHTYFQAFLARAA